MTCPVQRKSILQCDLVAGWRGSNRKGFLKRAKKEVV
jgi:hypothetical protein